MSNKETFITKCIELINETETSKKEKLASEILNVFNESEMIYNTPEEFKTTSLIDIKEILTNYISQNGLSTKNDVNQMCTLQSQLIND
jgi:hypothetical protein